MTIKRNIVLRIASDAAAAAAAISSDGAEQTMLSGPLDIPNACQVRGPYVKYVN